MHPSPISRSVILDSLRWRYATKKFDPVRKISDADWLALEDALVLTPSSFGLQPWKFLVITDPAVKEALVPVSWGQRQVADCSHLVVFAHRTKIDAEFIEENLRRIAQVRGAPVESLAGYRRVITESLLRGPQSDHLEAWSQRQTFIALGNFMTCAALMGIDACPIEGLMPAKYDEILGLGGRGLTTGAACPAGYRAADDAYARHPKVRFEKKDVLEYI